MKQSSKEKRKLNEAVEAYTKALAIKPDYTEAYNNMGIALNSQGKPNEAIEAYTKALAIKPDYDEAFTTSAAPSKMLYSTSQVESFKNNCLSTG